MARSARSKNIERRILELVADGTRDVTRRTAEEFKVSRQAAASHIRRLVAAGTLIAEGETKSRRYQLPYLANEHRTYALDGVLTEDTVWSELVSPAVRDLPPNIRDICHYGATEMVNNAIDHSASRYVLVEVRRNAVRTEIRVSDAGVGIFRKIREAYALDDDRHAILELVKGKLTTDPERHTGEGIFFTSRMFDDFSILSGSLFLWHKRDAEDWLIEARTPIAGTHVSLDIGTESAHTVQEVFDVYASDREDYAFSRTHVVVNLVRSEGENLVSRSQAKRLVARLEKFHEIVLDFKGVDTIGPAFADEIFRVFAKAHPGSRLTPVSANEEVTRMIRRTSTGTD